MTLPPERVYNAATEQYLIETERKAVITPEGKIITMYVPTEKVEDTPMLPVRVFVYGTLKLGYSNHEWHLGSSATGEKQSTFLGDGVAEGFIMKHLGGFPAAIKTPNKDWTIRGEVYLTNWSVLKSKLDHLEGYPALYNRELIPTSHGDAWIYYQPRERLKPGDDFIPSGIWLGPNSQGFLWPHESKDDQLFQEKFLIASPRRGGLPRPNHSLPKVVSLPAPLTAPKPATTPAVVAPKPKGPWNYRADTKSEGKAQIGPEFVEA